MYCFNITLSKKEGETGENSREYLEVIDPDWKYISRKLYLVFNRRQLVGRPTAGRSQNDKRRA
jgi:hypothetical protein